MRIVIAVGGNAIEESKTLNKLSALVAALSRSGNEIIITHGNGPQVGALALRKSKNLALLTKETQIALGERLRKSLLAQSGIRGKVRVRVVVTRVLVDKNDREFASPTKPIGKFYKKDDADSLARNGFVMKLLLKGYRRVVPSPKPKRIIELEEIKQALKGKNIVIAVGGGGVAVTKADGKLEYSNAVIDKDLASSLLAVKLKADRLFILTNVDGVFLNFRTRREKMLKRVSARDIRRYSISEHFEKGSMLPKVDACINFVRGTGNLAAIGNLEKPQQVLELRRATIVTP